LRGRWPAEGGTEGVFVYTPYMPDPKSFRLCTRPTDHAAHRAKELRRELTPPEKRLWSALKGKKLGGLSFRTQSPVGRYIADFYCHAARLVVEVDGRTHEGERLDHDRARDAWMQEHGIRVVRVQAKELLTNLNGVLRTIQAIAEEQLRAREIEKRQE
jgi:very-short-patch-repair endonuclease